MTTAPDLAYYLPDATSSSTALLGSHWVDVYAGRESVFSLLDATHPLDIQIVQNFAETVNGLSRFTVPLRHRIVCQLLRLDETSLTNQRLVRYDEPYQYDMPGLNYDTLQGQPIYSASLPEGIDYVPVIAAAGASAPWVYFVYGVDYTIVDGELAFRANPFDANIVRQPTTDGFYVNFILLNAEQNRNDLFNTFGFLENISGATELDRRLLNILLNSRVRGYVVDDALELISAITQLDRAREDESIELISDNHLKTPLRIYPCPQNGRSLNQTQLRRGEFIANNAIKLYWVNRGNPSSQLQGCVLPASFIKAGAVRIGDLFFENVNHATAVVGYTRTRLTFPIGGKPQDVRNFWAITHSNGLVEGKTFAEFLDTRVNPLEQPNRGNLPATINPFEFLVNNLLASVEFICEISLNYIQDRRRLHHLNLLSRIVDPDTAILLLLVQEDFSQTEIISEVETSLFYPVTVSNLTVTTAVTSITQVEGVTTC